MTNPGQWANQQAQQAHHQAHQQAHRAHQQAHHQAMQNHIRATHDASRHAQDAAHRAQQDMFRRAGSSAYHYRRPVGSGPIARLFGFLISMAILAAVAVVVLTATGQLSPAVLDQVISWFQRTF